MSMLGIHSQNYTITCEVLPRVPRQPAPSAEALLTASAAALADSFIAPPAIQPSSHGALGEDTALKVAAICAGASAILQAALLTACPPPGIHRIMKLPYFIWIPLVLAYAAAFVMLAGACCMWWGCCDCCCREPPSVEQYIGSVSVQSDTVCTDSSTHAIPAEFESLTYRLATPMCDLKLPRCP